MVFISVVDVLIWFENLLIFDPAPHLLNCATFLGLRPVIKLVPEATVRRRYLYRCKEVAIV